MNPLRHTTSLVCVPEHSAVLTMEALRGRTRSVGDRASEVGSMEEGSMEVGGTGAGGEGSSRPPLFMKNITKCIYGGKQSCTA